MIERLTAPSTWRPGSRSLARPQVNWTVGEIGNKRVRGHGLHMSMTIESPVRVLNPHAPLVQAAQLHRPEVHVPDPVVDFLQPDVLADADDRHVYPATIPPDPSVGANVPDLEAVRVLERRQAVGHRPRRGRVTRGGRLLVERLVRALVIELLAKDVEIGRASCRERV